LYSRFPFLSGSGAKGAIGDEESRGGIGEERLVVVEGCCVEVVVVAVVGSCFRRCEVDCFLQEKGIESMSKSISNEKKPSSS